jgi:hypothetical protein
MRPVILTLFLAGIIFLVVGYVNQIKKCPPPKIEYRFIPRTFEEEQNNPVLVSQLFNDMFSEPSTWVAGFTLSGRPSVSQVERMLVEHG